MPTMNLDEAKRNPDMPLRIATLLYELYCDQHGLTLESIALTERKNAEK